MGSLRRLSVEGVLGLSDVLFLHRNMLYSVGHQLGLDPRTVPHASMSRGVVSTGFALMIDSTTCLVLLLRFSPGLFPRRLHVLVDKIG